MEVEAVDEGTIAKIMVPEGTADVPVNQIIAVLAEEGEDATAAAKAAPSAPKPQARTEAARNESSTTQSCAAQRRPHPRRKQTAAAEECSRRRSRAGLQKTRVSIFRALAASGPHGRDHCARYRERA